MYMLCCMQGCLVLRTTLTWYVSDFSLLKRIKYEVRSTTISLVQICVHLVRGATVRYRSSFNDEFALRPGRQNFIKSVCLIYDTYILE